ncbi:hypothetical protein [Saccharopolyspora gloriosae]|uniref:hypothetical protein n=1 Tax=Saccharopolyspora gloriosae TaxID=455344 RepID=UPI001FB6C975|nr:hypothetical protein [Saccharopolyspora gloriosae]
MKTLDNAVPGTTGSPFRAYLLRHHDAPAAVSNEPPTPEIISAEVTAMQETTR